MYKQFWLLILLTAGIQSHILPVSQTRSPVLRIVPQTLSIPGPGSEPVHVTPQPTPVLRIEPIREPTPVEQSRTPATSEHTPVLRQVPVSHTITESKTKTNQLWIIRHCDKPNGESPCCSAKGMERANAWGNFFIHTAGLNKVEIIASNYNSDDDKVCAVQYTHPQNQTCQKSQRMFLTAMEIARSINAHAVQDEPNISFCVGEIPGLLKYITSRKDGHAVLVWEHHEIVEILRKLGVSDIPKWPGKLNTRYDIGFMVDLAVDPAHRKLTVVCWDYVTQRSVCDSRMRDWLAPVSPIWMDSDMGVGKGTEMADDGTVDDANGSNDKGKLEEAVLAVSVCFALVWVIVIAAYGPISRIRRVRYLPSHRYSYTRDSASGWYYYSEVDSRDPGCGDRIRDVYCEMEANSAADNDLEPGSIGGGIDISGEYHSQYPRQHQYPNQYQWQQPYNSRY